MALTDKLRGDSDNSFSLVEIAVQYLFESEGKSYVVLDDFGYIKDEALIQDLIKVIRALPGNFTVVIIGTMKPHGLFSDLILRDLLSMIKNEKLIFNPHQETHSQEGVI